MKNYIPHGGHTAPLPFAYMCGWGYRWKLDQPDGDGSPYIYSVWTTNITPADVAAHIDTVLNEGSLEEITSDPDKPREIDVEKERQEILADLNPHQRKILGLEN
ncbi:MAG: hypothetical protein ACREAU_00680 [Nitrosopumilaceae archaeon]